MAFIHPAHVSFESIKSGAYKSVAWTAGFTEYKVAWFVASKTNPEKLGFHANSYCFKRLWCSA
jgi:hypothetical protein